MIIIVLLWTLPVTIGGFTGFQAYMDNQRQQSALEDLQTRQMLVVGLLNSRSHGYLAIDVKGRITEWNVAMRRWTGWTKEEMVGQSLERIMSPVAWNKHVRGFAEMVETLDNRVLKVDCQLQHKNPKAEPMDVIVIARMFYPRDGMPPFGTAQVERKSQVLDLVNQRKKEND